MKIIQQLIVLILTLLPALSWSQTCDPDEIYAVENDNAVCIEVEDNVRMVYSNNYPDHTDSYNSPFTLAAGDYEYSMCAYPEEASSFTPLYEETETTKGCTYIYAFGVGLNGVKYDPSSAEYFENTETGENNIEWHIEARYIFSPNFGNNGGHLNPFGEYHYHDVPADYFTNDMGIDGSEHSPIVGYAADGFPMYYKYVYSDATDSTSGITALSSGYSLKSGTRSGDGVSAPDGSYTGLYYEDYEYSSSELDECNGRYGVTPDFPYGTYYYVLTDDYPYIPRCFKGTVVDNTFRVGPDAACPASTAATDCSMPVYGCMDPFSNNYNPNANVDDESCSYDDCNLTATISSTNITTSGADDGTATVTISGGQGNITYSWSNGASTDAVSNLAEGTYTVTVTDDIVAGCSEDLSVTITTCSTSLSVSSQTDVSCYGEADGSATVSATGFGASPVYEWSSGGTDATESGLAAGTYDITVSGEGCITSTSVTIGEPSEITYTVTSTDATCGFADGDLVFNASGGDGGPYEYSIDNGVTFQASGSFTNLSSGDYSVVIQDDSGCEISTTESVQNSNGLSIDSEAVSNVTTCGGSDGSIELTVSGGSETYTFSIDGGSTFTSGTSPYTAGNLEAGAYSIQVDDGNCVISGSTLTVSGPEAPDAPTASADASYCDGDVLNDLSVNGTGGTYTWYDDAALSSALGTGSSFSPSNTLGTSTYYVTETISNCESDADSVTVTINALPTISASVTNTSICDGESITLTGSGASSYTWDNNVTDGEAFFPTATTTYTVTGTDENGCSGTHEITVTVNSAPEVVVNATATALCEGESVTLNGSGATSYSWDNDVTDGEAFVPTTTTTYTVTGTDDNGCFGTDEITVTVETVEVSVEQSGSTLSASIDADSYQWIDCSTDEIISGETNQNFIPDDIGSYAVEVTWNGCAATSNCFDFTITGIGDDLSSEGLEMYPNPTDGQFTVDLGKEFAHVTLEILSISGKLIKTEKYDRASQIKTQLNVPSGSYLIRVSADDTMQSTHRITKK